MKYSCLTALLLCACVTIDISEAKRHYKKSVILHDLDAKKKFNIVARPQVSPDAMTVVLKGRDGHPGKQGAKGDPGKLGPQGPKGPPGDKGLAGVCSRTQCENEQLKALIQRLLALEKYVNNKLKNKNKTGGGGPGACSKTPTTGNPTLPPCTVTATVIAIVPFTATLTKPSQGGPQGKGQGQGQGQVPSKGPSKSQGGPTQSKPSKGSTQGQGQGQGQGLGQGQGQGQGKPGSSTINLSVTSSPSSVGTAPKGQTSRPTSATGGAPTAKPPATPTASPFVTLQGFTTYDTASMPPMAASQPATVLGGPLNQFADIPANWVTSGTGPIDLKPALYRRTPISRTNEQNFYSRGWSLIKKHNIPSPGHGLLTHKLAAQMLSKSSKIPSIGNKNTKKNTHHGNLEKHHKHKVTSKKSKHVKTRKVIPQKHH